MKRPKSGTKPSKHYYSTRKWMPAFLKSLAVEPNITVAARNAKIDRTVVYEAREKDIEFAKAWDDALAQGADMLESEAFRRATKGVQRPIYQGGVLVGHERMFSDTLTCLLLKAHKPAQFRERIDQNITGAIDLTELAKIVDKMHTEL